MRPAWLPPLHMAAIQIPGSQIGKIMQRGIKQADIHIHAAACRTRADNA